MDEPAGNTDRIQPPVEFDSPWSKARKARVAVKYSKSQILESIAARTPTRPRPPNRSVRATMPP